MDNNEYIKRLEDHAKIFRNLLLSITNVIINKMVYIERYDSSFDRKILFGQGLGKVFAFEYFSIKFNPTETALDELIIRFKPFWRQSINLNFSQKPRMFSRPTFFQHLVYWKSKNQFLLDWDIDKLNSYKIQYLNAFVIGPKNLYIVSFESDFSKNWRVFKQYVRYRILPFFPDYEKEMENWLIKNG